MFEEYKIEHVPVLKDYRHPTNPLTPKQEVKFYYHHKYMQFVKDLKKYAVYQNILKQMIFDFV